MMLESWVYFCLLGTIAGFIAGLLGVGGGLLIVPALVFIFEKLGFSTPLVTQLAVGTSLGTIVFTSLSAIRAHQAAKLIQWPAVTRLAPGVLLGAYLGSWITNFLDRTLWDLCFSIFCTLVALKMATAWRPAPSRSFPRTPAAFTASLGIGTVSSIFGIGGGSLTVPYLSWCNMPMKKAIAVSATCGFPIAIGGTLGFICSGWQDPTLPTYSLGYLYLPALLGVTSTSILFSYLGAKCAHQLPVVQLKRAFSILLFIIALKFFPI